MGVAELLAALRSRGETVAVAESLTGGLVAERLTSVAGASDVVRGGVVSYATEVKASVLGVSRELLAAGGAVQAEVAAQMAAGAARVCAATWGVATTGVAGPAPQDGQPVGTVFVAVSGPMAEHAQPGDAGSGEPGPRPGEPDPRSGGPAAGGEAPASGPLVRALVLDGDRTQIREAAASAALDLLAEALAARSRGNVSGTR